MNTADLTPLQQLIRKLRQMEIRIIKTVDAQLQGNFHWCTSISMATILFLGNKGWGANGSSGR